MGGREEMTRGEDCLRFNGGCGGGYLGVLQLGQGPEQLGTRNVGVMEVSMATTPAEGAFHSPSCLEHLGHAPLLPPTGVSGRGGLGPMELGGLYGLGWWQRWRNVAGIDTALGKGRGWWPSLWSQGPPSMGGRGGKQVPGLRACGGLPTCRCPRTGNPLASSARLPQGGLGCHRHRGWAAVSLARSGAAMG